MNVGKCRSCGSPVIWAITLHGKRMPVDAEPVETGNIIIIDAEDGTVPTALYDQPEQLDITAVDVDIESDKASVEPLRYLSHFATCNEAKSWRQS